MVGSVFDQEQIWDTKILVLQLLTAVVNRQVGP